MPRAVKTNDYFLKDMNPVIRFLILSDTVMFGSAGLLGPIFALFITDFIQGGNAEVAGVAAGIYLFTKSIFQIPFAHFIDKIRGERDDFWFMLVFSVLMALVPLLYLWVNTPMQLYATQFILGILTAFTYPSWMAIFTRHIDKKKEGTEWGIYFTLTDLIGAAFSAIGGYVATSHGFHYVIIVVVIMAFMGSLVLIPIRPYMKGRT